LRTGPLFVFHTPMVYLVVMRCSEHDLLTAALGVRPRELVALVGGGGKTGALQSLAREASAAPEAEAPGARILATTTTAMFIAQLEAIGPVSLWPTRSESLAALAAAAVGTGPVAAARALTAGAKVAGLPPEWVDELWTAGAADRIYVEADGSQGLSLKIFGPREPAVPASATLIVQVAGLDALGVHFDAAHVHRAELLESQGATVTPPLFTAVLRAQLRALRGRWPAARIVTLLNKAEDAAAHAAGLQIAEELLAGRGEGEGDVKGEGAPLEPRPEAVVVGSVRRARFTRCAPAAPLVSAAVLAAGRATRMGAQKLLLPVAGRPMIQAVVEAAQRSRVAETVVVVGSEAAQVRAALADYPVRIVENVDYASGMSTSLRAGLAAVRPDREAVLFVLGDQPFVTPAMIDRLIARFAEKGSAIVRPVIDGKPAHPVLMGSELFSEILALEGDVGAREIVARHPGDVDLLEMADPRSSLDVDTPEDYEAARDPVA
jgi:molybdenum cofactor cytidylyltransferase